VEDRVVAAAQEERFTRNKHDAGFPAHAISYCLEAGKVDLDGIDHVVFFEKPLIKFERLLETYLARDPLAAQHRAALFRLHLLYRVHGEFGRVQGDGPCALRRAQICRRSILGDPRNPEMQRTLNLKVKYRESFRPFAPSVLREDVADYFELNTDSPYMLVVADVEAQPTPQHDD
jgi:predicted NodU family carbamoyl transferase